MEATSTGTLQSTTSEQSSKSGSSKSDEKEEKDFDFTKDNVGSPIDLECHIQAERITKIIDECIYKTKLCICLPRLVQDYQLLASMMSSYHMDDLIFIFEQYDNPLFSASLLNVSVMDDIKAGDVSLKNRLNPELGHLVYILNSYPGLKPIVDEMIKEMKSEYLALGPDKETNPILEYLLAFEKFRELMVNQMNMTAAEELTMKLDTRKLETSNEKLLAKIQYYTEMIKRETEAFEKEMAAKTETINKLEAELANLQNVASVKLAKKVLDSERQMVLVTRAHEVKNELLKEEELETREGYKQLLRTHLMEEKNQRARRFKVETQLMSWLQKYDTEMTDKQTELDELDEKYEDERQRVEDLEAKIAEQDRQYIPLMEERDKEYHEEMKRKMEEFQFDHAARVIQVAWRQVLENRKEKRKLKKQLAKMKKAKEKEERRLEAMRKKAEKAAAKAAKAAKKAAKAEAKRARMEAKAAAKEAALAAKKAAKEKPPEDSEG